MLRVPLVQIAIASLMVIATHTAHAQGQFIDIFPKSISEIRLVLDAVNHQLQNPPAESVPPVVMMLHGPEAKRFLRSEYANNKDLIDQTARLSAFGLIEVNICETWMRNNQHPRTELFPFIRTVPYGAAELDRLEDEEGYSEFALDL